MIPARHYTSFAAFAASTTKLNPFNLPRDRQGLYWKRFERVRRGHYGRETRNVHDALQAQLQHVLDNIRTVRTPEQVIPAVRRATADEAFIEAYDEAILRLYQRVVMAFGERVFRSVVEEQSHGFKQDGEDELPDNTTWINAARQYTEGPAGEHIRAARTHTQNRLRGITQEVVREGVNEGWGTEKIARELEDEVDDVNLVNRVRARRIARTETITASNLGAMEAAQATGVVKRKDWIHTPDDRVRATHRAVGTSEPIRFDEDFTVGGYSAPMPADANLPARERINCRCTVSFLTTES